MFESALKVCFQITERKIMSTTRTFEEWWNAKGVPFDNTLKAKVCAREGWNAALESVREEREAAAHAIAAVDAYHKAQADQMIAERFGRCTEDLRRNTVLASNQYSQALDHYHKARETQGEQHHGKLNQSGM